jgi:hypothetical protein
LILSLLIPPKKDVYIVKNINKERKIVMTKAICKDMLQIEGHDTVYYSGEEYDVSASILKSHGDYFDVVEKTTKKNASVAKENK